MKQNADCFAGLHLLASNTGRWGQALPGMQGRSGQVNTRGITRRKDEGRDGDSQNSHQG